jgi:hypothetical protein
MRSSSVDNTAQKKLLRILIVSVSAVVILSMLQDKVEAGFKNSAFYFSESFIFSSFWWLFIPLIYLQWNFFYKKGKPSILQAYFTGCNSNGHSQHFVSRSGLAGIRVILLSYIQFQSNFTFRFVELRVPVVHILYSACSAFSIDT